MALYSASHLVLAQQIFVQRINVWYREKLYFIVKDSNLGCNGELPRETTGLSTNASESLGKIIQNTGLANVESVVLL